MKIDLISLGIYYLLIINLIATIVIWSDKRKAIKNKRRVPESRLHLFELAGGVLFVLPLLYLIRHKNRKFSYYAYTWLIFIAWISFICWLFYKLK